MTDTPWWLQNEGRFDRPSSTVPKPEARSDALFSDPRNPLDTRPARQPRSYVTRRLQDATFNGVIAVGTDTICQRIDAAFDRLYADGHGDPKAIYLIECDMLALKEAVGALSEEYRGIPVRLASAGTGSKVYSRSGVARAVRRATKSKGR